MDDRLTTAFFVVVGVPASLVGYIFLVELVLRLVPQRRVPRIRPLLWIAPALAFLAVFLIYPTLDTIRRSFMDRLSENYVGWSNYEYMWTDHAVRGAIVNNLLWLVFLTLGAVGIGLLVAVLVDRVRYEPVVKTVIFLPMAISFVAAGVIWRFMYDFRPESGTLNAIITGFGADPVAFFSEWPLNTFALIVVGVWMQVGFAMVILSAGLKSISNDLLEAARVDGATEWQIFRKVTFPLLLPTIAVISTAVIIIALKAFDIVYVMTNGNFNSEVLANRMYKEMFTFRHFGRASAIAVVLFLAIVPIMIFNIRRFREQEAIR
ncbi:MAG TPA: sugar ABC transporter permease [Natronosporangium sp.]|nr:sugar ABC transporter permease [Natronosporangium sp.]